MRLLVLLALLLNIAAARQYIQCASNSNHERVVININDEQSTLFISNGFHDLPSQQIAILKNLHFQKKTEDFTIYQSDIKSTVETIKIPNQFVNKAVSYFTVHFEMKKVSNNNFIKREYGCFSSVYND